VAGPAAGGGDEGRISLTSAGDDDRSFENAAGEGAGDGPSKSFVADGGGGGMSLGKGDEADEVDAGGDGSAGAATEPVDARGGGSGGGDDGIGRGRTLDGVSFDSAGDAEACERGVISVARGGVEIDFDTAAACLDIAGDAFGKISGATIVRSSLGSAGRGKSTTVRSSAATAARRTGNGSTARDITEVASSSERRVLALTGRPTVCLQSLPGARCAPRELSGTTG